MKHYFPSTKENLKIFYSPLDNFGGSKAACGGVSVFGHYRPLNITCRKCLKSYIYKRDKITFELALDASTNAWYDLMYTKYKGKRND